MVFGCYRKGSRAERELIAMFLEKGYSVIRSAGSGSGTPSPDILTFKAGKQFGFECKAWDKSNLGLDKEQFNNLKKWEENTGMTTLVAWRLPREGWFFIYLSAFEEQGKSFTVSRKTAELLNVKFDELVK